MKGVYVGMEEKHFTGYGALAFQINNQLEKIKLFHL